MDGPGAGVEQDHQHPPVHNVLGPPGLFCQTSCRKQSSEQGQDPLLVSANVIGGHECRASLGAKGKSCFEDVRQAPLKGAMPL